MFEIQLQITKLVLLAPSNQLFQVHHVSTIGFRDTACSGNSCFWFEYLASVQNVREHECYNGKHLNLTIVDDIPIKCFFYCRLPVL